MISLRVLTFICLVAFANGAPTETPAGQASSEATTKAPAPADTTIATTTQTASAPATDESANKDNNTTASMAVSQAHDMSLNTSSFTCYGRSIGYYADAEHDCKVYHFCLLGEYNGDTVYQRISYLCLNETKFDQQALDCVDSGKLLAPCKDSPNYFESSNVILREAIIGNPKHQETKPSKNNDLW